MQTWLLGVQFPKRRPVEPAVCAVRQHTTNLSPLLHQERGILVAQLVATYLHIQKYCEAEGWVDWQGHRLEPRTVTL